MAHQSTFPASGSENMPKKGMLKHFTIAVTGDFGEDRKLEKIKGWIRHHGGTYSPDVSPCVTHLVCSKRHFKEKVDLVKKAQRIKTVKIVSWDWLEDSLLSMKSKAKHESEYIMSSRAKAQDVIKIKHRVVRKHNVKKGMKDFHKSCEEFEKDMYSSIGILSPPSMFHELILYLDGYHIYHDSTSFAYDVTLARADLITNKNKRYALKVNASPRYGTDSSSSPPPPASNIPIFPCVSPRYARAFVRNPRAQRLQLYETHAVPHYYACYNKYSAPDQRATVEMLAPLLSTFELAFGNFKNFFKLKTGKEWDERLQKKDIGEDDFMYTIPKDGEPRGLMPVVDLSGVL